jgi:hypothetical protein
MGQIDMPDIHGTVCIAGIEFDIIADCDVMLVDDSFDHEFGTERCHHFEIEKIYEVEADADLKALAGEHLADLGLRRNRRFLKRRRQLCRRIVRELSAADADDLFTERDKDKVIEGHEPDYGD